MSLQKNNRTEKKGTRIIHSARILFLCLAASSLFLAVSCSDSSTPLVLWTENAELASYTELFNTAQNDFQVIVEYKKNPYGALPPAKDEKKPDIIIGSSHRDNAACQYLLPLDYLFKEQNLAKDDFYQPLVEMGFSQDRQYMLPISFNMPAVIFSKENDTLIPDQYSLSLDELRDAAVSFNTQKDNGLYTRMGFAPSWDTGFLYTAAKLNRITFQEHNGTVIWDKLALSKTVSYIRDWTASCNSSTTAEQDYQFKYLNIPSLKWITEGESLFAYTTSSELFSKAPEKLKDIDYRWLQQDEKTPIEDTVIFIGLYKDSKKKREAESFILWLLNADNQKQLLEWTHALNYVSDSFGICGGFSSIKAVNEQAFPIFYPMLLANLPQENGLEIPNTLPERWENLKEQVILPYLKDACDTSLETETESLENLITTWNKQYF